MAHAISPSRLEFSVGTGVRSRARRSCVPGITIIGSGRYAPGEPVPNAALARVMDTNDEWIHQRTGISQRHFAPEGVGASDLAAEAAKRATASAGLVAADIDYIVF